MDLAAILISDVGTRSALERLGRAAHDLSKAPPKNAAEAAFDALVPLPSDDSISDLTALSTGLMLVAADILGTLPSALSIAKVDQMTAATNLSTASRTARAS